MDESIYSLINETTSAVDDINCSTLPRYREDVILYSDDAISIFQSVPCFSSSAEQLLSIWRVQSTWLRRNKIFSSVGIDLARFGERNNEHVKLTTSSSRRAFCSPSKWGVAFQLAGCDRSHIYSVSLLLGLTSGAVCPCQCFDPCVEKFSIKRDWICSFNVVMLVLLNFHRSCCVVFKVVQSIR